MFRNVEARNDSKIDSEGKVEISRRQEEFLFEKAFYL
jgi:hypothetical protein